MPEPSVHRFEVDRLMPGNAVFWDAKKNGVDAQTHGNVGVGTRKSWQKHFNIPSCLWGGRNTFFGRPLYPENWELSHKTWHSIINEHGEQAKLIVGQPRNRLSVGKSGISPGKSGNGGLNNKHLVPFMELRKAMLVILHSSVFQFFWGNLLVEFRENVVSTQNAYLNGNMMVDLATWATVYFQT